MNLLQGYTVTIETNVTPPMTLALDGTGAGSATGSPALTVIRPRVTLRANGAVVSTVAPYGQPSPYGAVVALAIVAFVAWVVFR